MNLVLSAAFLLAMLYTDAQSSVTPGSEVVEKRWIKNTSYEMGWYAVKDTMRFEIGKTLTNITVEKDRIIIVTNVSMKQSQSSWIDSTIAATKDLGPIYHSSYNAQRDMALNFGPVVKGFYNDKVKNIFTTIVDTTAEKYFDSNLYPTLVTWLPLKEGYKQDISIYDYKPGGKKGVVKASINDVKKGIFTSNKSGVHEVWIVKVSDQIGGSNNGFSTYYIDVSERRLWKQQIEQGGRIMQLELIEK